MASISSSNSVYTGYVVLGAPHGKGKLNFNKAQYVGTFANGLREGDFFSNERISILDLPSIVSNFNKFIPQNIVLRDDFAGSGKFVSD